jgi:hypothetical protein
LGEAPTQPFSREAIDNPTTLVEFRHGLPEVHPGTILPIRDIFHNHPHHARPQAENTDETAAALSQTVVDRVHQKHRHWVGANKGT